MRLLKKVIRKIYHLIWFLSIFLLFTPNVFAVSGNPNTNGTDFYIPVSAQFYDNTNERLTPLTTNWNNTGKYYSSDLILNGANTSGGNLNFVLLEPVNYGYTYMLTVLIGSNAGMKTSTNKICIAENASNNVTRWHNDWCVTPSFKDEYVTNIPFNIVDSNYSNTIGYSILYFSFTSNITAKSIMIVFNSTTSISSTVIFGGYKLDLLSDNKELTQQQITSAVQSSGLATSSSIQEVQRGINQVQQQLSGVQDSIDDVNDTLSDSSVDNSDNTINSLKNQLPTNSVISDLLLLPVRLLQAIVNSLGGTCASFNLGSLYGTELIMPCIDLPSYLGNTIWSFIDIVFSGMFILVIRKKFIQIFENVTNLRNGGNEVD